MFLQRLNKRVTPRMPIIVKGNFINATGQKNSYYAANVRQLSLSLQSFDRFRFLFRIDGN